MAYFRCGSGGAENPVLLWTNSNPTNAFGNQTISLDLSNYEAVAISFGKGVYWGADDQQIRTHIFKKINDEQGMVLDGGYSGASVRGSLVRYFTMSDSGITFTKNYAGYPSISDGYGNICIPVSIYGYKKQNFPT